jgi:hypothetical protein
MHWALISRLYDVSTVCHTAAVTQHSRPNVKNAMPKINAVARVLDDKLAKHTEGGQGNMN